MGKRGAFLQGWGCHRPASRTISPSSLPGYRLNPAPLLDSHGIFLLLAAASAVIGLVLLIAVVKLNAFLSLMVVSLALAAVTGMPLGSIVSSFETGVGNTLGHIAIVVGLGTMLGKMMAESGASDRIAETLIQPFRSAARDLVHDVRRADRRLAGVF